MSEVSTYNNYGINNVQLRLSLSNFNNKRSNRRGITSLSPHGVSSSQLSPTHGRSAFTSATPKNNNMIISKQNNPREYFKNQIMSNLENKYIKINAYIKQRVGSPPTNNSRQSNTLSTGCKNIVECTFDSARKVQNTDDQYVASKELTEAISKKYVMNTG